MTLQELEQFLFHSIRDMRGETAEILSAINSCPEITPAFWNTPVLTSEYVAVPLTHVLANSASPEVIKLFLDNGADPNLQIELGDIADPRLGGMRGQLLPTGYAACNKDNLDLIIERGFDVDREVASGPQQFQGNYMDSLFGIILGRKPRQEDVNNDDDNEDDDDEEEEDVEHDANEDDWDNEEDEDPDNIEELFRPRQKRLTECAQDDKQEIIEILHSLYKQGHRPAQGFGSIERRAIFNACQYPISLQINGMVWTLVPEALSH